MRLLARLAHAVGDRDLQVYRDCLADEVLCLSAAGDGEKARARVDVVAEMQASDGDRAPARVTVGGRYDLQFARLATGRRTTKRHMTTRYTIGDPMVVDRARGARHAAVPTSPSRAGPR
jgi:hypothetical protein